MAFELKLIGCLLAINGLVTLLHMFWLRLRNRKTAHNWSRLEEKWEPILEKIATQKLEPKAIFIEVQDTETLYFVDYLWRKWGRQPQYRETYQKLAAPYLHALVPRLTKGDPEQKARALLTLGQLGFATYHHEISTCLDDRSDLVALITCRLISEHQALEHSQKMLSVLPRFHAWNQTLLISLLVDMGKKIEPDLLQAFKSESENWMKTIYLKALTQLQSRRALPLAVAVLEEACPVNLQVAALQLLGALRAREHSELVRSKMQESSFPLRLNAIRSLALMGLEEDKAIFEAALEDDSHWVAIEAAEALKNSGEAHVLKQKQASDKRLSKLMAHVLGDFTSLEHLVSAAQNEAFEAEIHPLLQQLKRHDSREVGQFVSKLFFNPQTHPKVRYAMAAEIKYFKEYQFFFQTLSCFNMGFFNDQVSLIKALGSFKRSESTEPLAQYYRSSQATEEEKLEIIDALGEIDCLESIEFLSAIHAEVQGSMVKGTSPLQNQNIQRIQKRLAEALARKITI